MDFLVQLISKKALKTRGNQCALVLLRLREWNFAIHLSRYSIAAHKGFISNANWFIYWVLFLSCFYLLASSSNVQPRLLFMAWSHLQLYIPQLYKDLFSEVHPISTHVCSILSFIQFSKIIISIKEPFEHNLITASFIITAMQENSPLTG